MAEKTKKPFNLLYKIDVQKSFVDKLYEIVVGPARLVVVIVLLLIIGVFVYRFPLDTTVADQKKQADRNLAILKQEMNNQEKTFRDTSRRTDAASKYLTLYKDPDNPTTGKVYPLSYCLQKILEVGVNFPTEIVISDYTLESVGEGTSIKLNGGATSFGKIDEYVAALRQLDFVTDASSINQASQKGQVPKFTVDIKIKQ